MHAGAGSAGFEWHWTPMTAVAAYYGVDYYGQNFFPDTTNAAQPGTIIGYGGPGSPNYAGIRYVLPSTSGTLARVARPQ